MKRKLLAALCVTAMSAGLLAGCGSSDKTEESTKTEETAKEETSSQEETETKAASSDSDNVASEEEAEKAGFSDGSDEKSDSADAEDKDSSTSVLLDTSKELTGTHHAEIEVKDYGTIDVELDADTAPITVTNFVKLAQEGFYDGLTFHRIMDGFMIQGGDPNGDGTGGSEENIKGEFSNNGVDNDISHTRGTISMARASDPDSASSQFFIVQADSTFLDGDYAGFGHVTEGMDIVDKICEDAKPTDNNGTITSDQQPVIEKITIID
ncbi:peptidylprolyl isomerase [Ruminococcus sp. AM46-18]|jgi:cyclophilin family peptidyl-prolyl cis-trans isomerase|nr:peptidylprolyl isomerase [Ruminococcus sp. AM46-18]